MAYHTDYWVPDPRLSRKTGVGSQDFPLLLIRNKKGILRGLFRRWDGVDLSLGVIARLNGDRSIKKAMKKGPDVIILAKSTDGCWVISTNTRRAPSKEFWEGIEGIANHLLAAPA